MPFTTAHTALVIPVKKIWPRYFSLTGLLAGSMAPDLIYFLQLTTIGRGTSHSWTGLLLFCLPAGVMFSFAFHWLFKYHFINNLPSPFDRELSGLAVSEFQVVGFRSWLILVVSVLTGAVSHFFWDSFTHPNGVIARAVPFLMDHSVILGIAVTNTKIAQHLSTVVGTLGLIFGLTKGGLLPSPQADYRPGPAGEKSKFWIRFGCAAVVFALLAVLGFEIFAPYHPVKRMVTFGLAGWAGFFYSVAIYAVSQKARRLAGILMNFLNSR